MAFSKDGEPTPARALPRDSPPACTQRQNKMPATSHLSSTPPSLHSCQLLGALMAGLTPPEAQPAVISFEVYLGVRRAQHPPSQLQRDAGFQGQSTTGFSSAAPQQSPKCCFVPAKSHYQLSLCWPKAPATPSRRSPLTPPPEGITHGTQVGQAAILLLSTALLCLPIGALSSSGLLSAGPPWARLLLSCALLLLQDAPSVQDAARTESHPQRPTPPLKQTSFPGRESARGRQTSGEGVPLQNRPCTAQT